MSGASGASLRRALLRVRPRSESALRGWLRAVLGIDVPSGGRCSAHSGPMEYLAHVFFERPGDVLVWANRGGGKTFYGAVATLLDLLFKPGVEVRVLGGSFEQSAMMYRHLRGMLERPGLRRLIDGRLTERGVRLVNGSRVELLAQAETSVRGHRVQKLRCDEADLFEPDIWSAAQFVTRSAVCGGVAVRGAVEALSTAHRPHGLMSRLIDEARGEGGWKLIQWCALDVMGRCGPQHACRRCRLWDACEGRAKRWRGFLKADDVLGQARRTSGRTFASEMLCQRPSRSDAVFAMFDPAVHVRAVKPDRSATWVGGMDFGMRDPFVMLWAQLRPRPDGAARIEIIDEYIMRDRTLAEHLAAMARRPWPRPAWIGADPSGDQRSSHSGLSTLAVLRRAGYIVRTLRTSLIEGLDLLQRRIEGDGGLHLARAERDRPPGATDAAPPAPAAEPEPSRWTDPGAPPRPAADGSLLAIHPRCRTLIESLTCYHFDAKRPHRDHPVKDGHDHAADALRYLVVNLDRAAGPVEVRRY